MKHVLIHSARERLKPLPYSTDMVGVPFPGGVATLLADTVYKAIQYTEDVEGVVISLTDEGYGMREHYQEQLLPMIEEYGIEGGIVYQDAEVDTPLYGAMINAKHLLAEDDGDEMLVLTPGIWWAEDDGDVLQWFNDEEREEGVSFLLGHSPEGSETPYDLPGGAFVAAFSMDYTGANDMLSVVAEDKKALFPPVTGDTPTTVSRTVRRVTSTKVIRDIFREVAK